MPEGEKDARGRLQRMALYLLREHGYDRTTAAQIAARAGVTERTFFRHFPDKREVLFDGQATLGAALTAAIAEAPAELGAHVFELVSTNQADVSLQTMCRMLDVSTSGYYASRDRAPSRGRATMRL